MKLMLAEANLVSPRALTAILQHSDYESTPPSTA